MQYKILIVTDDEKVRQYIEAYLQDQNRFIPLFAGNLKESIQQLKDHPCVFAALLDLSLPDAPNGEIVDFVLGYEIPAIIITQTMDDEHRDIMLRKPIVDYVIINNETDIDYAISLAERLLYYHQKKVLVVDDSSTYRKLLSIFLEELLFDVYTAKNGEEALEIIQQNPDIKVCLVDYHMPGMDGLELVQHIRNRYMREDMAIIAVTGYNDGTIQSKFLKRGADDYLVKPFTKEEFNCRLIRSLRIMEQFEKLQQYIEMVDKYVLTLNTDAEGTITYVSDALARVSGYSKKELIGNNHRITRHPDMPGSLFRGLWKTIAQGKEWHGEIKNLKKDGGHYWIEANIHPLLDNTGFHIGYTSTSIDITDKKRLDELNADLERRVQEEIRKNSDQQALLVQQSKMASMGEMLGNIAHQWKQPLSAISFTAQTLPDIYREDGLTQDELDSSCKNITKQVMFMNQTINDFRNFFRPSKKHSCFSITGSVQAVLRILEHQIIKNKIRMDIAPEDHTVCTISNEVEHVLLNIINNAKDALIEKHSPEPFISIRFEPTDTDMVITIEDNAGGIPIDIMQRIFEPYFSTKGNRGTGLGLYICKLIIEESLKGSVIVENSGQGAKFTITFPNNSIDTE